MDFIVLIIWEEAGKVNIFVPFWERKCGMYRRSKKIKSSDTIDERGKWEIGKHPSVAYSETSPYKGEAIDHIASSDEASTP